LPERGRCSNQQQPLHAGVPVLADDDVIVHRYPKSHSSSKRMQIADFRYKRRGGMSGDNEATSDLAQS
jgi:hypothetical protein